jgi:hypothetical protein
MADGEYFLRTSTSLTAQARPWDRVLSLTVSLTYCNAHAVVGGRVNAVGSAYRSS